MKEDLYSDSYIRIIVQIPFFERMLELVSKHNYTNDDLSHWIAFSYQEMLSIQYESYYPHSVKTHYVISKLLEDYKIHMFHEVQEYIQRFSFNGIVRIRCIPLNSIMIFCSRNA